MIQQKLNIGQISAIAIAIVGVIGLYFWGQTTPTAKQSTEEQHEHTAESNFDVQGWLDNAESSLTAEEQKEWEALKNAENEQQSRFWASIDRNDIAGYYSKKQAEQLGNSDQWNLTGDLYVRAYREVKDSVASVYFVGEAIHAYEESLNKQANDETKMKLAKLHTEITGDVMKAVPLLQQIVADNPNHIQANYELGLLSIQSGQDEKALERMNTLINAQPEFIEPYLLKAQLLMKKANKEEALTTLSQAIEHAKTEREVEALNQIKTNILNN